MEIVIGIVGLVIGAIAAVIAMRTAKQGSLREADSRLESARAQADQLLGDAQRQAETLKKEALLEAKEEIIQNKEYWPDNVGSDLSQLVDVHPQFLEFAVTKTEETEDPNTHKKKTQQVTTRYEFIQPYPGNCR